MRSRFVTFLPLLAPAVMFFTSTMAHAQKFNCSSNNGQYQTCTIPNNGQNNGQVQMTRQLSQAPCVQGQSWGQRGNQVWVNKGCRAEFIVNGYNNGRPPYGGGGGYHGNNPYYGPPRGGPPAYYSGNFSDGRSNCSSGQGGAPIYCQSGGAFKYANPIRVNSACIQNRTWGVSQYGLWVSNGCGGQWEIKR